MPGNEKILRDVEKLLNNLLTGGMEELVEAEADEHTGEMADANREQLLQGLRSDGSEVSDPPGRPYAPFTVRQKLKVGQPVDKVTLLWTGQYHAGIFAAKYTGIYEMQSSDSKDEKLQAEYGDKIMGVSDENLTKISQAMKPGLITRTRNFLQL